DIREAWEARQLTCQAIAAQVSRPRERIKAKESDEDMPIRLEQSEDETPALPRQDSTSTHPQDAHEDIAIISEEETDEDMPALEESEEKRPALPRQDSSSTCPVTLQKIHEDMNPSRSPESSTPK
ncbi:hypothetical protein AAFF_G00289400, partial [Aldrovandia affinis]